MKVKIFLIMVSVAWVFLCSALSEAAIAEYLKDNITPTTVINRFNNQLALNRPKDVYVDGLGNLYVVDAHHQAVFVYDDQYQPLTRLSPVNGIQKPVAVAVDHEGNIYVSDREKGLLVFNSLGKIINTIDLNRMSGGKVHYATDLMIDGVDHLYLATGTEQGVLVLDKRGKLRAAITPVDVVKEDMPPVPVVITRVTIDSKGRIYLVSEEMGRIYVYEDPKTFLFKFGRKGGSLGKLSHPVGIAADCSKNLIYVIDYMRHTLSMYDLQGVFLEEYGGQGEEPGWFNHPEQIYLDEKQRLVVADFFNHRIQILTINSR
jgi:DNA-binding beta-propeller fold protein YncE